MNGEQGGSVGGIRGGAGTLCPGVGGALCPGVGASCKLVGGFGVEEGAEEDELV
jgi:hypothetical protein